MSALKCPFCSAFGSFEEVYALDVPRALAGQYSPSTYTYRFEICPNPHCRMGVSTITYLGSAYGVWPEKAWGKQFDDVPEQIAATANEAHVCLSASAPRAAVAMARAVVEATAKDHGITKGSLASKIEAMADKGIISQAMREAADEIRFAGNEVAHGDLAEEPIDEEDAQEVVSLMDTILLRVYQEPKQVERVRERRTARRTGEPGVAPVVI